jgi:predicted transcriptional regulator
VVTKTTVYLENDLALTVRQLAATQGRSQAELIRDALETYTRRHSKKPVSRGFGKYSSGEADVSERAEEILMDAARRGRWR